MARKADDLLADLDSLGVEEQSPSSTSNKTSKPSAPKQPAVNNEADESGLDEIAKQLAAKPTTQASSRPSTPRLPSSSTTTTTSLGNNNKSPKRAPPDLHTPASSSGPASARASEETERTKQQRSSGETAASLRKEQKSTPAPSRQADVQAASGTSGGGAGGGGWWGALSGAATAAVKQAESLAKEIRANEEAQKWAEQVRGYGQGLQTLSTDLRTRALPTFTSLISHIAPPISAHERLQIHITHDILAYPSLDPVIYHVFSRVMAQVEGGDLLVIQRGLESRGRTASDATAAPAGAYRGGNVLGAGGVGGGGGYWGDGAWWRDENSSGTKRDLGAVVGLREGTRLARVSAESYAREFFDRKEGGLEVAAQRATETLSESNPTRSSDIFLAIQPIKHALEKELFAEDARRSEEKREDGGGAVVVEPAEDTEELVTFAVYLHDPIHSLSFSSLSQPFPAKWASWIDADPKQSSSSDSGLPDSILEIIQSGGVDPREWVVEWMEEILSTAVGVVAQKYVARRMGVGEGGLGRGKRRAEEDGIGGEAARAI